MIFSKYVGSQDLVVKTFARQAGYPGLFPHREYHSRRTLHRYQWNSSDNGAKPNIYSLQLVNPEHAGRLNYQGYSSY